MADPSAMDIDVVVDVGAHFLGEKERKADASVKAVDKPTNGDAVESVTSGGAAKKARRGTRAGRFKKPHRQRIEVRYLCVDGIRHHGDGDEYADMSGTHQEEENGGEGHGGDDHDDVARLTARLHAQIDVNDMQAAQIKALRKQVDEQGIKNKALGRQNAEMVVKISAWKREKRELGGPMPIQYDSHLAREMPKKDGGKVEKMQLKIKKLHDSTLNEDVDWDSVVGQIDALALSSDDDEGEEERGAKAMQE